MIASAGGASGEKLVHFVGFYVKNALFALPRFGKLSAKQGVFWQRSKIARSRLCDSTCASKNKHDKGMCAEGAQGENAVHSRWVLRKIAFSFRAVWQTVPEAGTVSETLQNHALTNT